MAYNNPEISSMWRNAWSKRKDTFRSRYVKSLENLSEQKKLLPPVVTS